MFNVAGLQKHQLDLNYDTFSQVSTLVHEARVNKYLTVSSAADSVTVRHTLLALTNPALFVPQCCNVRCAGRASLKMYVRAWHLVRQNAGAGFAVCAAPGTGRGLGFDRHTRTQAWMRSVTTLSAAALSLAHPAQRRRASRLPAPPHAHRCGTRATMVGGPRQPTDAERLRAPRPQANAPMGNAGDTTCLTTAPAKALPRALTHPHDGCTEPPVCYGAGSLPPWAHARVGSRAYTLLAQPNRRGAAVCKQTCCPAAAGGTTAALQACRCPLSTALSRTHGAGRTPILHAPPVHHLRFRYAQPQLPPVHLM